MLVSVDEVEMTVTVVLPLADTLVVEAEFDEDDAPPKVGLLTPHCGLNW